MLNIHYRYVKINKTRKGFLQLFTTYKNRCDLRTNIDYRFFRYFLHRVPLVVHHHPPGSPRCHSS